MPAALISPQGLMRLSLAALVLVSHMSRIEVGRLAVILFFVLSGYWVSDLWVRRAEQRDRLRFYLSRLLRIWPLYIVIALVSLWWFEKPLHLTNITLLGIASQGEHQAIGVEWSLDIELQFYLLLPFIHACLDRFGRVINAVAAVVLTLGGWALSAGAGIETALQYLPAFLIGLLIFRSGVSVSQRTALGSLAAFVALTLALVATEFGRAMILVANDDPWNEDVFAMLWCLPLIPYVIGSIRLRSSASDRMLGDLSYSLYLVHWVVLAALKPYAVTKPLAAGAAVIASLIIFFVLDRPFERWRRRLF